MKFLLSLWLTSLFIFAQNVEVVSYDYYLDVSNTWEERDAYAHKDDFAPLTLQNQSLGFRNQTAWVYVKVKNSSDAPLDNIVVFPYPQHDNLSVYKYSNGKVEQSYTTGDLHPFESREIASHTFSIPYRVEANSTKELLFKIESNSSLNIGVKFYSAKEYEEYKFEDELFLGIYYGIIFIIIAYNFILYFIVREKVYFHYATFHLVYFFLHFAMNGLSFKLLYPNYPQLNLYVVPIFFILANYLSVHFTIVYLDLKRYEKKISHYLRWFMRVYMGLFVMIFLLPYALISQLMTVVAIFSILTLVSISIYVWYKHRTSSAKIFVIGWGMLLLGASITVMQNLGLLPMNTLTNYGAQIGAILELSLLSLNLAYNYNVVFRQSQEREKALQELSNNLESKVIQRTYQLNESNHELSLEIENKNVLFKELYHRVKNNLQIIASLLSLQSMEIKDTDAKKILEDMTHRIQSIAFIHEKLYQSSDLTHIDMQEYIESLVNELQQGMRAKDISFLIECSKIKLNLELSVPLGLIINELITNALKHAFNTEATDKSITIKLYKREEESYSLIVWDNGKGADIDKVQEGFGFQIVESIVSYQIDGEIKSSNNAGLQHEILFEKKGDR
ncbi:MAG: 7TM diverse intracellular signaling domain-containing protein [Campylobacterota bacterium]|nr:7TM diverse intracellular signaling domain-containing protein [Campylobacterota bacterium]